MRLLIFHIADYQGGALLPGGHAHGVQVGYQMKVTIAERPVGILITRHRLHLHIHGEQIVAAVGAVAADMLEKEAGVIAFAHKAPVEISKHDHHGIDLIFFNQLGQRLSG